MDFRQWLNWATDRGRHLVGILRSYSDASGRGDWFVVAACLFDDKQAEAVDAVWSRLFDPYGGSHWAELIARQGRFKALRNDDDREEDARLLAKRNEMMVEAIAALRGNLLFSIIVACRPHEIAEIAPFGPYLICSSLALRMTAGYLVKTARPERIAYTFEMGDPGEGEVVRLFDLVQRAGMVRSHLRHYSHQFLEKEDCSLLATADCLGWEMTKNLTDTHDTSIRAAREAFKALELTSDRNAFSYIDHDALIAEGAFLISIGFVDEKLRPTRRRYARAPGELVRESKRKGTRG